MTAVLNPQAGSRILYVTYDGITDPLGRSQVLPYLTGLSKRGHHITILSCEKPEREVKDGARIRALCDAAGIEWRPIRYHKKPPVLSSAYDAAMLRRAAERLHRAEPFDIVHCRSYIPGIAGMHLKRKFGVRFLFDMRGFWPDEKVEGKSWPQTNPVFRRVYRWFKSLEAELLTGADHIISLTYEGKRQLLTRPQLQPDGAEITVIPCCVDFTHFPLVAPSDRERGRQALGIAGDARVLVYLGSLGSWYMLDEMLDFFRVMAERDPKAVFLFVTHDTPESILAAARTRGVPEGKLVVRGASREEVPVFMAAADVGIFFIAPVFSKKASSPTKMGEMLAIGLPLVTNGGVGDVAQIVEETGCGVAIESFDEGSYREALDRIEAMVPAPEAQREKALPWFDVEIGIARYDAVYESLAQPRSSRA
ncbi:MAG TPA: glycosyltransferase [Allosphingosinicella sp.]|jgi:glycosyltransferase involved in cell wall biosynthesis